MKEPDRTVDFYRSVYSKHGASEAGVGWGMKNLQTKRFESLTRHWDLSNKSVLDIGAGLGDLFDYLKPHGIGEYTGIEQVAEFCDAAMARFHGSGFDFIQSDIYGIDAFPTVDVSLISGTFNVMRFSSEEECYSAIDGVLRKLMQSTREGIAINFLSDDTTFRSPDLFYANSEIILGLARAVSRRVVLSHFDLPFEFCLYIWTNDEYLADTSRFSILP
jgi:SAM-dependent methyltransferase